METYEQMSIERSQELASELKFSSNHCHTEISNFRLRDCIIRTNELINRAIELGYCGVCCTDHEALSAHVRLLRYYNELKTQSKLPEGFKLGLGNEIYLIDDIEDVTTYYKQKETSKYWHFILIAKDPKGYEQLKRISSESAWKNWFKQGGMERVPTIKSELEAIIGEEKGHLIASSACLGSELDFYISKFLESGDLSYKKEIDKFIKWAISVFGKDNFFLEIQPCVLKTDETGKFIPHEQAIVDQFMFTLADAYGLNIQVTEDAHYLDKKDRKVHEAYLLADDEDKQSNREVGSFYETTYLFDKAELVQCLSTFLTEAQIIKAFNGTQELYSRIETFDLYHSTIVPTDKNLPKFELSHTLKEYYATHEYINKFAHSDSEQDRYLLYLIEKGIEQKHQREDSIYHFCTYDYGGSIKEEHDKIVTWQTKVDRIEDELSTFWQISERLNQNLSAYYVLVRGLVHEVMWKVSFVGIARGSVGGCYTAYLADIIQINPLKYDLPFYRHLSNLRPELPDIDLDSESLKRQQIFENMHNYYGDENVLNTLTLKTEGTKSTVQVCARGYGIPIEDARFMADLIPFERGSNWTFKDCFEGNEEKNRAPQPAFINEVEKYPGLKDTLLKIEGLISGRSIHASASYIFDKGYLAQNSRMRAPNGTWITAFNMEDSDYMGGLKVD